jgi:uncharacterized protein (DUF2252 family)
MGGAPTVRPIRHVGEAPTVTDPSPTDALPRAVLHLTESERRAHGKAVRAEVPRSAHGRFEPNVARRDPVDLLVSQAASRVPELVPVRYGRMLVSPFTFYRGGALLMAADLADGPRTGLQVQLCGDAHLSNFGVFASPERRLVFDLNDFDETLPGPFEWDLKRLAASFEVAGRDNGFAAKDRRNVVLRCVQAYREAMRDFAAQTNLEVWYAHLDVDDMVGSFRDQVTASRRKIVDKGVAKARTRDSMQAFEKLTAVVDGERRIVSDPPLIVPIEELATPEQAGDLEERLAGLLRSYRATLSTDRRHLLEQYRLTHVARKVVGVGSVGTRAWILLLLGKDENDPLFLQAKEAQRSVLEGFLGASAYPTSGHRVVAGQRLMQASSDIFLGWEHVDAGLDGQSRDFYIRQLRDGKGSAVIESQDPPTMAIYANLCGWTLARAHARSGDRIAIAAYLGNGDGFDRAIADFSSAYADLNEQDFAALQAAAADGRIEVSSVI